MNSLFNFIKSKISILDIVSQYATLKKTGVYWKGRCPFHHEKTASFTISPHKEIFYCFGCHEGGDVITFVTKIENCSPLEAAKLLAEQHGITIPPDLSFNNSGHTSTEQDKNLCYYKICALFAKWGQENLHKNHVVMTYLHNRNIHNQSIDTFELGYIPGGLSAIKACIEYFRSHNFLLQDLIDANLIARGKTILYSPFEERIIFPIKDHLGRHCGFGGRVFKTTDTRPKYYNSKENELFTKGSLLFGLNHAKKAIQQNGLALLVEGYTDCIAMAQHNFANTIATLGTACTISHLKLIARYAHTVLVVFDGDQAGHNAIMRLAQLCWQVNLDLKIVQLPQGHDPASFLAQGSQLAPLIEQAQDIFLFFVETAGAAFSTKPLNEKMQVMKNLLQTIAHIDEPLKRDLLLQRASQVIGMPFKTLQQETQRLLSKPVPELPEKLSVITATPKLPPKQVTLLEERLFCSIVNNPLLANKQNESYLLDYIANPLRDILKKALDTYKKPDGSFNLFFDILTEQEKLVTSKLITEHVEQPSAQEFGNLLLQLQRYRWRQMVQIIKKRLGEAKKRADQEETNTLLTYFLEFKQKLLSTTSFTVRNTDNQS
jgi:DNA primase